MSCVPSGMFLIGSALPVRMSASGPGDDRLTDLEPGRREDVTLLAISIIDQRNPRRSVRIVFDRRHLAGIPVLSRLKSMITIVALVSASAMTNRDPSEIVAAVGPLFCYPEAPCAASSPSAHRLSDRSDSDAPGLVGVSFLIPIVSSPRLATWLRSNLRSRSFARPPGV